MAKKPPKRKAMLLKISAETFDLLTEFSEVTGMPKMTFVAGILDDSRETIRDLIKAAREAQQGTPQPGVLRRLQGVLREASAKVDQLTLGIDDQIKPKAVKRATTKRAA